MSNTQTAKGVDYYSGLPYTIVLRRDEDGDVVARIEELDGCAAHGANDAEALVNIDRMRRAWIEACIESGRPVPEPEEPESLPSGKWVQRVPRSLHQALTKRAKREGVSLNALVTSMLAAATGKRTFEDAAIEKANITLEPIGYR